MPRVFIGMPARNASGVIREALEAIRTQSYTDWMLVVSDNASTDNTAELCEVVASFDQRIRVLRQPSDLGMTGNFGYVLSQAAGDYFVWAAADDRWKPDFLRTCVELLDARPDIGLAFTGIENINARGQTVRSYPDLARLSGPASPGTVASFLLSPEINGKANLIYGLYRLPMLREVWKSVGIPDCWGGDMAFVLGVLARSGVAIGPNVLFQKRLRRSEQVPTGSQVNASSEAAVFPVEQYEEYRRGLLTAVRETRFEAVTSLLMSYRYRRALSQRALRRWRDRWIGRVRSLRNRLG
jgi:glycosyltransferase involved in cell wall biosynthesis